MPSSSPPSPSVGFVVLLEEQAAAKRHATATERPTQATALREDAMDRGHSRCARVERGHSSWFSRCNDVSTIASCLGFLDRMAFVRSCPPASGHVKPRGSATRALDTLLTASTTSFNDPANG